MSTDERREKLLALESQEQKARNLFVACRTLGDVKNQREARRDLASILGIEKDLRAGRVAV